MTVSIPRIWRTFFVIAALTLAACDNLDDRVNAHYEKGLELLENNQPQLAELEFRNAVKLDDQFAPAYFEFAKIWENRRDLTKALTNYFKTIEINPDHVEARVRAANILIIANELERAATHIDYAYKLQPHDTSVLIARGLLRIRQKDFDGGEADALAVLKSSPAEPRAGLILATVRSQAGKIDEALEIIDRFLEVNTYDVSLNLFKLQILQDNEEERKEELTAHLNQMKRIYPNSLEIRRMLSRWYMRQKNYSSAEVELRKLQELQPGNPQPVTNLIQFVRDTRGDEAARNELVSQIAAETDVDRRYILQKMLAESDYAQGRIDAAYRTADQMIAQSGSTNSVVTGQLLYGQFRAREERFDEAMDYANKVLEIDGKNAQALGMRAAVLSEQGDQDAAVIVVRAALNESPRNQKLHRLAARIYRRNGNTDLTGQSLATAASLSNYDPEFVRDYVTFLRTENQTRSIEAVLSEAVRHHPQDRELLAALAAARLRLEDWNGAEQIAEQLRQIDDTDAAKVQAAVLSGQQRYGESIDLMQRLAAEPNADSRMMAALVQVYVKAGQTREARAYINKVLEENPKNPRALRLSGALFQLADNQAAAEQAFRDAILAEPLNGISYVVLARYLKAQERPEDAEEILRAGVANVPGNVILHIDLADSYLRRGAFDEAIQEFEVVYDLQPDSMLAANNLASMLADFHADKPDLVDRAFSIARRLAGSDNPAHMDTYGWIQYLRGDYAQALRSLRPAAEQLKNSPWTQYHAGMAYLKLDRHEEARRHLQAALDAGGAHMFPLREQVREALEQLSQ